MSFLLVPGKLPDEIPFRNVSKCRFAEVCGPLCVVPLAVDKRTLERFYRLQQQWIARPRNVYPYPGVRFDAR